jgi:phage RecT family recombinase
MAKNQAVATRQQSTAVANARPIDLFKESLERAAPTIMKMLPAHIPAEKFKAMIITAVAYDPKLLECETHSLLRATAEAAELGLSLNKALKEADILPAWSPNGSVAQMRPRYMGLMKLARQSGDIVEIYSHVVRQGDHFDYEYGLDKRLVHKPAPGNKGELIAAYCVWQTKDGTKSFEVLDREKVLKSRDKSEGWKAFNNGKIKSTPWSTDEEEMWRKTAVRAASKYMPMSSEKFAAAVAIDNAREVGEPVILDSTGDVVPDDITAPAPQEPTEAAATQVTSLEGKIAPKPAKAAPAAAPATDYAAWAERSVADIAVLDAAGCTKWRKENAKALQDAEFNAPDEFERVRVALDG